MMGRAVLILNGRYEREKARRWLDKAPLGTRIEFKASKRTTPQNDRMWAMLTILADSLSWYGQKLTPDDWKLVMLDGLNRELRAVPSIDGRGFVNLGRSSSSLTKDEMTALMDLIEVFAAQHGVDLQQGDAA